MTERPGPYEVTLVEDPISARGGWRYEVSGPMCDVTGFHETRDAAAAAASEELRYQLSGSRLKTAGTHVEEALAQAVIALKNVADHGTCDFIHDQCARALELIGDGARGAIAGRRAVAHQRDAFRDALAKCLVAFQHTREYLGPEALPAVEGWSWYDAVTHGEAVLARNGHPA